MEHVPKSTQILLSQASFYSNRRKLRELEDILAILASTIYLPASRIVSAFYIKQQNLKRMRKFERNMLRLRIVIVSYYYDMAGPGR